MKFLLFVTLLVSIAKSGIWICVGILLRKHFDTIYTLLFRKPIPEDLIEKENYETMYKVIQGLGAILVLIGVFSVILAISTFIYGNSVANGNFNFKF